MIQGKGRPHKIPREFSITSVGETPWYVIGVQCVYLCSSMNSIMNVKYIEVNNDFRHF